MIGPSENISQSFLPERDLTLGVIEVNNAKSLLCLIEPVTLSTYSRYFGLSFTQSDTCTITTGR